MNSGGIRADINAGPITYGEAFSVQPFANVLVTMDMTGAQIDAVLEQQFQGGNGVLQISGVADLRPIADALPAGNRISNIRINGVPIDPAATYRVTVNNFLADGGDGYTDVHAGHEPLRRRDRPRRVRPLRRVPRHREPGPAEPDHPGALISVRRSRASAAGARPPGPG